MKTMRVLLAGFLVLAAFVFSSCSGPTVDATKPIAEIETEAEKMTPEELRRMAEAYRDAILEKHEDIETLQDKLKDLEPEDLLSSEAKAIATEANALGTTLAALTERFDLYMRLLEREDGDTAGLDLD